MVAVFGEVTGKPALQHMHNMMLKDPVGQLILEQVFCHFYNYKDIVKGTTSTVFNSQELMSLLKLKAD